MQGDVYSWGANIGTADLIDGRLGLPGGNRYAPHKINIYNIVMIAAGYAHSVSCTKAHYACNIIIQPSCR